MIIQLPKNRCEFCKKREATLMCDKVVGTIGWAGHPPKINGVIQNWDMQEVVMCNKLMCEKCVTHIDGMDVCPDCNGLSYAMACCIKRVRT